VGVRFTKLDDERAFQLVDTDGDGGLGFADFVDFFVIVKQIEIDYAGNGGGGVEGPLKLTLDDTDTGADATPAQRK
jgi:hypothetical protein